MQVSSNSRFYVANNQKQQPVKLANEEESIQAEKEAIKELHDTSYPVGERTFNRIG